MEHTIFEGFKLIHAKELEDVIRMIEGCESRKHVQQSAYSSNLKGLTQICFGCRKVRTTISRTKTGKKDSNYIEISI